MGEATAAGLARHYGDIEALVKADLASLEQVPDVGPIVAQSIVEFLLKTINAHLSSSCNRPV